MVKRARDDLVLSPQSKELAIRPPPERSGKAQMSTASTAQVVTDNDALTYLRTVKEKLKDRGDKYNEFLQVMKAFKATRIDTNGIIRKVKELFEGDRELVLGFNAFLPEGYKITLPSDDQPVPKKKRVCFDQAINYVNKIKARFQGDHSVYSSFLSILDIHFKDKKPIAEVYQKISVLFKDHPDLQLEFTNFLPDDSSAAPLHYDELGYVSGSPLTMMRPRDIKKPAALCDVREQKIDHPDPEQFVEKGQKKRVGRDKNEREDEDISGHKRTSLRRDDSANGLFDQDCLHDKKQIFQPLKVEECEGEDPNMEDEDTDNDDIKDVIKEKQSANKEKFMAKPIQELDLSNCDRCTPSYRLLPDNYPTPSAFGRNKIGNEVLNDRWVSVTSGSEDYSFNHMRRNQYEESLFRCEDDRFELDVLLESVKATAKRVEELLDSMNDHTNKTNSSVNIEDHLTVLNLRCIERLYGEHGLEVMDMLRKNAPVALPVILTRLKQKQLEWESCRSDFNKVWVETYAKNYRRSLDHMSFHFKQEDKKRMNTKALLAEIKEMSEKDQNEEEMIMSISAGYRQPIRAHMKFEYPDPDIQRDLYELIKYSCGEVCMSEQRGRVVNIWTNFLEPLFGVPSHPLEQVITSDTVGISINEENNADLLNVACEEIESSTKSELEEGEISPSRNLDEKNAMNEVAQSESPDENRDHDNYTLQSAKPITKKTHSGLHFEKKNSEVFYGNDSFYLLFRFHQILYERMHTAKVLTSSPENKPRISNDAERTDSYTRFKDALHTLLNRTSENAKFEDECRAIIGAKAYIFFSLDKLIHKLVKQLQKIESEEMDNKLLELYEYERSRNPEKFSDAVYHENARFLLPGDELYRIECVPSSPRCLTIQLMKNEHDKPKGVMDPDFAAYLNNELLSTVPERSGNPRIFLKRNKRRYSTGDEVSDACKAMEGLSIYNGLEIVINCNTSKASYVLDTEDILYRRRKGKRKPLSKGRCKILSLYD
ncbi:PREDICTED: paired amphipathic helix protein Sin3-like 3 isoform X2 [Erythranthe guttata]|uniref:paired amphipathic helix protein Sin3-like 3 isoform X2 n=1 Tax=Erythranthe guttata TaxID=4155 RepID=UPI00064D81E6|nr:PREDICTED: paired amphipathic helix protein Sin3-like 3 isoform X2 [Erythranthe guttata]|eukprot:XP_012855246.1 PREDICTED: paired amphipathic helix protein Sin3-like 3 isoform X2 [Erythranthe guttata]